MKRRARATPSDAAGRRKTKKANEFVEAVAEVPHRKKSSREGTMEAKVDIRKLQLLNDRVNQTLEALQQVRFSVHGLHHSWTPQGFGAQGWGTQAWQPVMTGYGIPSLNAFGWNLGPQMPQPMLPQLVPGLSHTIGINPMFQTFGLGQQPFGPPTFGIGAFGPQLHPVMQVLGGITHSNIDPAVATDPYWNVRVAQTFPLAPLPFMPIW
jgi:hypothetical protein